MAMQSDDRKSMTKASPIATGDSGNLFLVTIRNTSSTSAESGCDGDGELDCCWQLIQTLRQDFGNTAPDRDSRHGKLLRF
jgi:hypothetical protein